MPATVGLRTGSKPEASAPAGITRLATPATSETSADLGVTTSIECTPAARAARLARSYRSFEVFKALWDRIVKRRQAKAQERADEFEHMSPDERQFVSESVDDRAAELESEAHGGGELED
jgi:hypothetical protein